MKNDLRSCFHGLSRTVIGGSLIALAMACAPMLSVKTSVQTPDQPTVPERDIAAAMQALAGATILETERYKPQVPLVGCGAAALPVRSAKPGVGLAKAIAAAQAYHMQARGVGLVVLHNGSIIHENYTEPASASSRTESASMMKSVLGLLIGIAIEKEAIDSVDDRAGDYLREWDDDPRGDITLRQLLTMSSGLGSSDFARMLMSSDIRAVALETPLADKPDATFAYNNAISQLLGTIVDKQVRTIGYSGFHDFLQRELWCPLGNEDAALWIDRVGGSPRYYAGLQAVLRDWARLGELIRNNGVAAGKQIVPADWIAQMTNPSIANPQYGFHIWLGGTWTQQRSYSAISPIKIPHSEPYKAKDVYFFDGFGGQRVYTIPSHGLTIARTGYTNLAYDDAIIVNLFLDALPPG